MKAPGLGSWGWSRPPTTLNPANPPESRSIDTCFSSHACEGVWDVCVICEGCVVCVCVCVCMCGMCVCVCMCEMCVCVCVCVYVHHPNWRATFASTGQWLSPVSWSVPPPIYMYMYIIQSHDNHMTNTTTASENYVRNKDIINFTTITSRFFRSLFLNKRCFSHKTSPCFQISN